MNMPYQGFARVIITALKRRSSLLFGSLLRPGLWFPQLLGFGRHGFKSQLGHLLLPDPVPQFKILVSQGDDYPDRAFFDGFRGICRLLDKARHCDILIPVQCVRGGAIADAAMYAAYLAPLAAHYILL